MRKKQLLKVWTLLCVLFLGQSQVVGEIIFPSVTTEKKYFGQEVCTNGKFAFVYADITTQNVARGQVLVYEKQNGSWVETQVLTQENTCVNNGTTNYGSGFGGTISSDGDWLAIGAKSYYVNCSRRGMVFLYKLNGNTWEYHSTIESGDDKNVDFAATLSLDNEKLVVGVPSYSFYSLPDYSDLVWAKGAIYMYAFNENTNTWQQQHFAECPNGHEEAHFGSAVSISGDWVIASAPDQEIDGETYTGMVYLYQHTSGVWVQAQAYELTSATENSVIGETVDIEGDYAFITFKNSSLKKGIRVLKRNGGTWSSLQDLSYSTTYTLGYDISAHGNFMVASSVSTSGLSVDKNGEAVVYYLSNDEWIQTKAYSDPIVDTRNVYGNSVAVGDSGLFVGAYEYDTLGVNNYGIAYVYPDFNVIPSVNADFGALPMVTSPNVDIDFTDRSSATNTIITSWSWDFDNDGNEDSDVQNPTHQFATEGHHPVTLTVSDGVFTSTSTRWITVFPANRALCTDYIPFAGNEANNQGMAAWNGKGAIEADNNTGHALPMPPASIGVAYYYLASRDYSDIDAGASAGMSANDAAVNWPNLTQALANNGKSIEDLNISFGLMSLGDDIRAANWQLDDNEEWRIYTGGTYSIKLNNEELISGNMPSLKMNIAYFAAQGGTDMIDGETTFANPVNTSAGTSPEAQAIAAAFMNDINGTDVKFMFSSIQSANQFDFDENDREGGFFTVDQGFLLKGCPCAIIADAGADLDVQENTDATLNVDTEYSEGTLTYLWEPATGLDDPTLKNPTVNTDQSRTYTVTVTDERNCQDQDEVRVDIFAPAAFESDLCEDKITPFPIDDVLAFGTDVAINGQFAFVSSNLYTHLVGGEVRTFTFTDGAWVQTGVLSQDATGGYNDNTTRNTEFGAALDSDGDWLIIGAPSWDSDDLGNIGPDGVVFIYKRNGNNWIYHSRLSDPNFSVGQKFGYEVSIDGTRLAVGSPYKENVAETFDPGAVLMYEYNAVNDTWEHDQTIYASDGANGDSFGRTLKLENDHLVVGAYYKTLGGNIRAGAAYMFEHNGAQWNETDIFTQNGTPSNGYFGGKVSLAGDYAMVIYSDVSNSLHKARVYKNNAGVWAELSNLEINATGAGINNLDLSMDGDYAAIADKGKWTAAWTGEGNATGWAFLYKVDGGNWSKIDTVIPSDPTYLDAFGGAIDLESGKLISGAISHAYGVSDPNDDNYDPHGTAYVYSCFSDEPIIDADFTFDPVLAAATTDLQFTDLSNATNTVINSWSWDFDGDGNEDSDVQNPVHSYATAGNYPVTLTVSDGEAFGTITKWVTAFSASMDSCNAFIPFAGTEAMRQGVAGWNSGDAGDEPEVRGHLLPQPPASIDTAYYYLASRDYRNIDPDATAAMTANGAAVNWPNLTQALLDNGKSIEDLEISFGLMSLGDDVEGEDWDLVIDNEWRKYTGGSFYIRLEGEEMISGPMPELGLFIDYNAYLGGVDKITGITELAFPQNNSAASSAATQAVAQAFMDDCNGDPIKFFFASIQAALQMEFEEAGRNGGFFDVEQGYILKSCPCNLEINAEDDFWGAANEDIQLTLDIEGGVEPISIEWSPSIGLDDAHAQNPIANLANNMTYSVTVTDGNGCTAIEWVDVHIDEFGIIEGIISDISSGQTISKADVELFGPTTARFSTEPNGFYRFENVIPSDNYKIVASAHDYHTDSVINQTVISNETLTQNFQMQSYIYTNSQIVSEQEVQVYTSDRRCLINPNNNEVLSASVYNLQGQKELDFPYLYGEPIVSPKLPQAGIYLVVVQLQEKTVRLKVLVK